MLRRSIPLLTALLLAACDIGPDYQRPSDNVPGSFAGRAGTLPVLPTTAWWLTLNDPILDGLVERARRANPDLGRAQAVVAEARAALAQAQGGGTPQLNAGASASYGRSFTSPNYYGRTSGYSTGGFDASWEIDLWGRNRRTVQAAAANAELAEAEADDALLTLLGDVARSYVELRGTQAGIETTNLTIENQKRSNELAARRVAGGDGSRLEILQGATLLQQQEAQRPVLQARADLLINALSTLCGEAPDALRALLSPPGPIPQGPLPDPSVPADLLRRRPDVRAAERQLAAGVALIGAAMAERYPSLSLSGSLTLSGGTLSNVMAAPLFALSPSLRVPVLDGGQREAAVDIRRAQAEQARHAYRTVVLKALREVEDAMAQVRSLTQYRDGLKQTVLTAGKVVDTARSLYSAGATDFLQVLDAQRALTASRDALAQAEAARTIQVVALFKALGGGWQTEPNPRVAAR
ncbi:efflux transporter outer membrane subunit [Muricoccus aerilatus]|uniref:efflux transporter outer membrane subunit n=1 Tax=Muricoccus aerilatus TaxID=452982 RepID=UPI0005C15878|nr:efflux transporter outer membrane subunit [Roseomonas aerilata]